MSICLIFKDTLNQKSKNRLLFIKEDLLGSLIDIEKKITLDWTMQ